MDRVQWRLWQLSLELLFEVLGCVLIEIRCIVEYDRVECTLGAAKYLCLTIYSLFIPTPTHLSSNDCGSDMEVRAKSLPALQHLSDPRADPWEYAFSKNKRISRVIDGQHGRSRGNHENGRRPPPLGKALRRAH